MRKRWHDPYAGRWLTRDPAGYVDGLSLYLYVRGGPLRFVDPWGLASEKCYQVNGDLRDLEKEMGIQRGTGNHEPNELTDQQKKAGEQWEQEQGEFFREQGKKLLKDASKAAIGVAIIVSPADEAMVGAIAAKYGARAAAKVAQAIARAVKQGKSSKAVSKAAQEAAEKVQRSTKPITKTEPGSYTNTHESGKSYHGKGDPDRARRSGQTIEREHNDPHVSTEHKPAPSHRDAFKDEDRRIQQDGGSASPSNYNQINSPGKKYREQDGD